MSMLGASSAVGPKGGKRWQFGLVRMQQQARNPRCLEIPLVGRSGVRSIYICIRQALGPSVVRMGQTSRRKQGARRSLRLMLARCMLPRSTLGRSPGRSPTTTAFIRSGLSRTVTRPANTASPYSLEQKSPSQSERPACASHFCWDN
jgi:hypothetical protein